MEACVQKLYLEMSPSREDHLGDVDRLRAELAPDTEISLSLLRLCARLIRESDYRVTATVIRTRSGFRLTNLEPGDTTGRLFALGLDLGSTTVVGRLLDLRSGAVLAQDLWRNHQRDAGDDILSRIFFAKDNPEHLEALREKTVLSINELTESLCEEAGLSPSDISAAAIAGNTTMVHLLLGLEPFCIFHTPFLPRAERIGWLSSAELGFCFGGLTYIFPSAANYMGGDITSGVLATGVGASDEVSLFIDIGTNGEMVIGCRDYMIAGAGAAGPALEGDICRSGMRAKPGAVDSIRIDGDTLTLTTIGNKPPLGICGSGIVDLMAQMLLNGWIDGRGTLAIGKNERLRMLDGEPAVVYAENPAGEPLAFTQHDIELYTESKAAAHTMVVTLLEAAGLELSQVKHIKLAGAFGTHMSLESAITIGIYPDIDRSIFEPAGNSSLEGACALLLGKFTEEDADRTAQGFYYLEFAMQENFVANMQAARFYPHTDLASYPSVAARMKQLQ